MSMAAERVVCSDCETRDENVNFSAKKNGNIISGEGRAMVRASRFGGAALIAGVLCLATCTTRVGGDYVQPVANPGDEPGQVLPVDLDTGMPMVPPAFPPSFVARVAWRVTRAEGETDAVVHGDGGGSGSGDRTLATVYHERKVQAERIDVHSREGKVTTTFIILHGKGVCYRVTYDDKSGESRCVHAPTPGPAVQTRLSHVAASFRGKERVGTIPDDLSSIIIDRKMKTPLPISWLSGGTAPCPATAPEKSSSRSANAPAPAVSPGRYGPCFTGPTAARCSPWRPSTRAWNHSSNNNNNLRLDPGLFRPPKDAATRCVHDDSGELSKSLEHRNTLHFNPLYYPRVGGGGKRRGDSDEDENKKLNSGGTGGSGSSPMGSRRGEGTARRRVVANKDGSKPAAPWESHGVDPAGESKGESDHPDAKTQTGEVKTGSSTRSYSDLLPPGTATSDGNKGGGYLSDRGWVDAGIVDGIPESKDDGSGPPHEYALLGSGSDEL